MAETTVRDDQLPAGAGTAAEVEPIPSASVIVLRDSPLEVLMIRRHERSSFVPSVWVFPGGAAEEGDFETAREIAGGDFLDAMRLTGLRETFEETGIWLGPRLDHASRMRDGLFAGRITLRDLIAAAPVDLSTLVWTSRWITPVGMPKRFDTCFFLAVVPALSEATVDEHEAVEVLWISPEEALARHRRRELPLVFPTIKNLEAICGFSSAAELLASRSGIEITPTCPVLVIDGAVKKLVLPRGTAAPDVE